MESGASGGGGRRGGGELCRGPHQLIQTKAKIIQLPIKFTLRVKTAAENKKSELSLLIHHSNGKSTKGKFAVECQLKSLHNGSIIKCNVDLIKGNEYRILCTPTVRGRHKLTVTANGVEVAGSPFPVFVSIDPRHACQGYYWSGVTSIPGH